MTWLWYLLTPDILNTKVLRLFDFFTEDIAIDLGTANTLIIHNDKVVVDEPSIVATELKTAKVIAVGTKAQQMHGKAHRGIETNRPLKDGVIADFDSAEQMIKEFIKSIPSLQNRFWAPSLRMVICIPSGITEVEKRAYADRSEHIGDPGYWNVPISTLTSKEYASKE